MLLLVRSTDTAATVAARRQEQAAEVARIAAAPVQHVPEAFLLAVEGLFPDVAQTRPNLTAARG